MCISWRLINVSVNNKVQKVYLTAFDDSSIDFESVHSPMNGLSCKPAIEGLLNLLERLFGDFLIKIIGNDGSLCTCVCFDFNILPFNPRVIKLLFDFLS